jgi:hypothetical protein
VSTIDILPTVTELLGLPPTEGRHGRSLAPLWRGVPLAERPTFTEGQDVRALRAGGWAYLRRPDGRLVLPGGQRADIPEELYDLSSDPLEHDDRSADPRAPLKRMRALFDAEAPAPPEVPPAAALHLALAPSAGGARVSGELRSDGAIAFVGLHGAEVTAVDAHRARVTLSGAAQLDMTLEPPDARLELALLRGEGSKVTPLVGPFALPLFGDTATIDGARWDWIDAPAPPVLGERGDVLLWRDPSRVTSAPSSGGARDEVAGMMRRWGYAQPDK